MNRNGFIGSALTNTTVACPIQSLSRLPSCRMVPGQSLQVKGPHSFPTPLVEAELRAKLTLPEGEQRRPNAQALCCVTCLSQVGSGTTKCGRQSPLSTTRRRAPGLILDWIYSGLVPPPPPITQGCCRELGKSMTGRTALTRAYCQ
ncbi:hypothetical protein FKM82_019435 [Ascaphus truei]